VYGSRRSARVARVIAEINLKVGGSMNTIWLGVKIGIGIIIGFGLVKLVFGLVVGFLDTRPFRKVSCSYQHEGGTEAHPNGWMTRDPNSNDWILWDEDRQRLMRLHEDAHLPHRGARRTKATVTS
jgi:hypothetical protein